MFIKYTSVQLKHIGMKRFALFILAAAAALSSCAKLAVTSPDKSLSVDLFQGAEGNVMFRVSDNGECLMDSISVGLSTASQEWKTGLRVTSASAKAIKDDYVMVLGKRSHCINEANEATFTLKNAAGAKLNVVFRAYNDGVAFRYELPEAAEGEAVTGDNTVYNIPDGTNRWIAPYHADGYEDFFPLTTNGEKASRRQRRPDWGYPVLIEPVASKFILISEGGLERDHCGSWLRNEESMSRYAVVMADDTLAVTGSSWESPWRVMIAGGLDEIVESTLINDVSPACAVEDTEWIQPAPAAWIYWANNHGSSDYKIVTSYMDLAKEMGWPYNLIDAEWDGMTNGGNIEDALAYSNSIGVKSMIWYNSSTNWINGAPTPYYRLNKPEDREKEYSWLNEQGVVGIKVDFFRSDRAEDINYYYDLMADAAKHKLLINFHGATLPRGWQRTYPNLVSTEAVYGAEWYNNMPILTNRAAAHNATLPFTRNVVGSMDYTPGTFSDSQHPHITTNSHELALTVLFESGVQHMPDRPEAYLTLPEEIKSMLSAIPTAWDDTKFLAGYPGESVVIARRKGNDWYIAGINGKDEAQTISFNVADICDIQHADGPCKALLVTDGPTDREFTISTSCLKASGFYSAGKMSIPCQPRGGFTIVLKD